MAAALNAFTLVLALGGGVLLLALLWEAAAWRRLVWHVVADAGVEESQVGPPPRSTPARAPTQQSQTWSADVLSVKDYMAGVSSLFRCTFNGGVALVNLLTVSGRQ